MCFSGLARYFSSSQTESVDGAVNGILNPLSLALGMALLQLAFLPLLGWRCHPLGAARIRTLFGVPDLVSFSDPVKSGKDTWKEGAESKKLPRKSIQYYLAMYPRINGQVSKDTLASKLGSVFS